MKIKSPPGAPRMAVRLRPERLTQFGFRPVDVLEAVEAAYQGAIVAQVHDRNRVTDVAVMLDEANRREPEQVASLMLKNCGGPQPAVAGTGGRLHDHRPVHHSARQRQPPPGGHLLRRRAAT